MNTVVIRVLVAELANPGEIGLVEIFLEECESVLKHGSGVVLVEG